jgi:exopolysaccharide biosynthesis polyprenyl glycosylphosphotransferase
MIRLFQVSIPTPIVLLVVGDSLLLSLCYLTGAYFGLDPSNPLPLYMLDDGGWLQLLFVVAFIQMGLYLHDWYENALPAARSVLVGQLSLVMGTAFLVQSVLSYGGNTALQLPKWTMFYGSGLVLVALPAWRIFFYWQMPRALRTVPVVFWGTSPTLLAIVEKLAGRPDFGYQFAGYFDAAPHPDLPPESYLGPLDSVADLERAVERLQPRQFVISRKTLHADAVPGLVRKLLEYRLSGQMVVAEIAALHEAVLGRVATCELEATSPFEPNPWMLRLQTLYSFVGALLGLLLCLPVMAVVALAVRLSSPGPVLYRQTRVGLGGKTFPLYKFRSMYSDAEARSGPVWATKEDPRITPLGRHLRKLRLDELPQFFNVLRGDMALVGPRPERPEFCKILEEKIPFFGLRHYVKPGITGWAQINYPYADTIEDTAIKLEYDLYYIRHMAVSLDAYILFHTAKIMLLSRGSR